jgi:hypothetical protein
MIFTSPTDPFTVGLYLEIVPFEWMPPFAKLFGHSHDKGLGSLAVYLM